MLGDVFLLKSQCMAKILNVVNITMGVVDPASKFTPQVFNSLDFNPGNREAVEGC